MKAMSIYNNCTLRNGGKNYIKVSQNQEKKLLHLYKFDFFVSNDYFKLSLSSWSTSIALRF